MGVIGTSLLMNNKMTDNRSEMNNPVLPEVMISVDDVLTNRMCGYYQKMQGDFMRDSITPLDASKKLTVVVNPYESRVVRLFFEVRTTDGSKVIENKKLSSLAKEEGYLWADIELEKDLRMTQEYSLQITLETEEGPVYFYTRIVQRSGLNTKEYVAFVENFAKKCLDRMQELKEDGKTIVFISHSLPQVQEFCDSAMWLEGGKMREYGDIDTVCEHYAEYIETYNTLTKAQKKAERDEKFKERIIKDRKPGLFDRLFG